MGYILQLRDVYVYIFFVRATNDVKTFHVPYLSFLSPFSRAAVVGLEEAKRNQKGYHGWFTNNTDMDLLLFVYVED